MIIKRNEARISKPMFLKALLSAIIIASLIFYFKAFFTKGVYFEDTFLKKESVSSETNYIGKDNYGSIQITVKGLPNMNKSTDVIFNLPNNIRRQYTVNFKSEDNLDEGIENIKDKNGNIIFSGGKYRKDFHLLFDENGEPVMADIVQVKVSGQNPYTDNYKVSLSSVTGFATFENDTIRGKYKYLVAALLIFVFTLIDIKFPLFFFTLRNILDVKDPEPSDFYTEMQRISWYISPVIAIILMIVAIS